MRVRLTSATNTPLPNRFWRQWWATTVSNLGDGINFAALPLLAYSLTDDERLLSLTAFVTLAPWLVLALPVGVLVDHADRRMLMITANVARVGLFGVIALTAGADSITDRRADVALGRGRHLRGGVRQQRPGVPPDAGQWCRSPACQRLPVRGRGGDGEHPRTVGRRVPVRPRTRASVRGERGVVCRRRDPDRVDQGRTHASPAQRQCTRPRGAECNHRFGVPLTVGRPPAAPAGDHADRHQLRVDVRARHLRQVRRPRVGSDRIRVRAVARRHRPRRRWRGSVRAPHDRSPRDAVVDRRAVPRVRRDAGVDRRSPGHRCRGCRRVRARRLDHVVEHRHPVDPSTRDRAGAVRARQQRVPLDRYRCRRLRSIGRRSARVRDEQPARAVPRGRRHHARRACPVRHTGPTRPRTTSTSLMPATSRRPHRR